MGANIGILNAADSSEIGQLSAAVDAPTDAAAPVGVEVVDVSTETVIDRPVEAVAAYAGDPANAPEWYANIASVRPLTPPPVAVGSRIVFVAGFLGRRLEYTYEVAELEPSLA